METEYVWAKPTASVEGIEKNGVEIFSLHEEAFSRLTGPGVYFAMTGTGSSLEVLYIGSAKNLLARISDPSHKSLRKAFLQKDCRILFSLSPSEAHAREMEAQLIKEYQPTLNIAGKYPG